MRWFYTFLMKQKKSVKKQWRKVSIRISFLLKVFICLKLLLNRIDAVK